MFASESIDPACDEERERIATIPPVTRCEEPRKGHTLPGPCTPPPTMRRPCAAVPFNAPVRFGYEVPGPSGTRHVWIKAGEPPRACTTTERNQGRVYAVACSAKIGDELFQIPAVRALQ